MALTDLFTTFQAADYCKVSFMTIKRWISAGKIKAHKTPGGHYRIVKRDFQIFMMKNNIPIPENDEHVDIKILIVDDDKILRDSLEDYLKEERFEVITTDNGYEACFLLNQYLPDIIILDLIMPNVDGFKVCELIKGNSRTKDINIIILTGYASEENVKRVYEYGVNKVLSKPVDVKELLETIYTII